jgi:3-hydroxybutyrate dehydrogenase
MKARGLTREQVMNDVLLAAQPTKQFVSVEQVAALAVFLCRDEASAITGANLSMDGGGRRSDSSGPAAAILSLFFMRMSRS